MLDSGFAREPFPPPTLTNGSPSQTLALPSRPGGAFPQSQPGASLGEAGSPPSLPRSSVALCKLLQHGITADDRRLQDIRVKGEELHSPDEGVRTRSKSAKSAWPRPTPAGLGHLGGIPGVRQCWGPQAQPGVCGPPVAPSGLHAWRPARSGPGTLAPTAAV